MSPGSKTGIFHSYFRKLILGVSVRVMMFKATFKLILIYVNRLKITKHLLEFTAKIVAMFYDQNINTKCRYNDSGTIKSIDICINRILTLLDKLGFSVQTPSTWIRTHTFDTQHDHSLLISLMSSALDHSASSTIL
jgi:hypothetical protein